MRVKAFLPALLLFQTPCSLLQAAGDFYLNGAERIVICGDDPAQPRLDAVFLEAYLATRFPHREVTFISTEQGNTLEKAILMEKPTVLILLEGDKQHTDGNELVQRLALPSLRVSRIPFLDPHLRAPTVTTVDLLVSWNAPALVSAVEIDAAAKRVVRSGNTTVRELESDLVVAWSQDDLSLPLPAGLVHSRNTAGINIETLQVTGLGSGKYRLTIDGWSMGEFWRESFENGIDLTLLPTPMLKQADRVLALLQEHARGLEAALPATHDYEISPVSR
jgi:hypothetical protein